MTKTAAARQAHRESSMYRHGSGWIVSTWSDRGWIDYECSELDHERPYVAARNALSDWRNRRIAQLLGAALALLCSLSASAAEHRQSSDGQVAQTVYQVNVNTATSQELQRLYRTGPAIAEKIIAGRPYADLVELVDRVPGIGVRWAACNGDFVAFAGPTDLKTKVTCPETGQ